MAAGQLPVVVVLMPRYALNTCSKHRPPFWRARELLAMRRVDQGHARNLVGVPSGIHLGVQAALRMA
jgi:hypothetical protein